jgi:hypothetical protein
MDRRGRAYRGAGSLVILVVISLLAVSCSSVEPSASGAPPGGSVAVGSPLVTAEPSLSPTPAPTATPVPTPAPTVGPTASATPPPVAKGCPAPPVDLATARDLAKAGRAVACFGSQPLTFRAYVPMVEGLGGVSGSRLTPRWIADAWSGVIVQPKRLSKVNQDAWLIVRVRPSLGACTITDVEAAPCPFGGLVEKYVTLTGHFDDPVAQTCRSRAWDTGGDPGPSKKQMIASCRAAFVVTAVKPTE